MNELRNVVAATVFIALGVLLNLMLNPATNTGEVDKFHFEEISRVSTVDCMDLWAFKMEMLSRRNAAKQRELEDADAVPPYTVESFQTEYKCDLEQRLGSQREDGVHICSPAVFTKRDDCTVYSILSDTGRTAMENEVVLEAECKARVLEPMGSEVSGVPLFKSWAVLETPVHREDDADGERGTDLLSVMDEFGDQTTRIDVLRIECAECDDKLYAHVFDLIETGALSVGQMVIQVSNSKPEILKLIDEQRDRLDYLITRRDIKSSCRGKCADISLISRAEAKDIYGQVHCSNSGFQFLR